MSSAPHPQRRRSARERLAAVANAVRRWTELPSDRALLEEHRQTVLFRTRVAAWIAAVVIPFTILTYVGTLLPDSLPVAAVVTAGAEVGVLLVLVSLRTTVFRRHYHVPFFALAGIVCHGTEIAVLELTGGGARSHFLFPYFLVMFGVATLFPARFAWTLATVVTAPLSYLAGELAAHGSLEPGASRANLILLVDYAFIAAIASRVTTRLFFSEAENRRALEVANHQLRELDKAKSDFFANVSHDLRSPLTVILGPLNSILGQEASLSPRNRQYLQLALSGAARLDSMVNDLLDLARIDAGLGSIAPQRVDATGLLGDLVEAVRPWAAQNGIAVVFDGPGRPVYARIDADKIERVAMNLLSNAFKYSAAGTQVAVRLRSGEDGLWIEVADQGAGIAPEDLERIFVRFTRGRGQEAGRTRGAAWAWRWSGSSSTSTAAGSRSRAGSARAPPSRCSSRRAASTKAPTSPRPSGVGAQASRRTSCCRRGRSRPERRPTSRTAAPACSSSTTRTRCACSWRPNWSRPSRCSPWRTPNGPLKSRRASGPTWRWWTSCCPAWTASSCAAGSGRTPPREGFRSSPTAHGATSRPGSTPSPPARTTSSTSRSSRAS